MGRFFLGKYMNKSIINKKMILNTIELFRQQFGLVNEEDQKDIFLDEFIFVKDFEDNEFVVRSEIKSELWKPSGKIKYNTIIIPADDYYINYDTDIEVDYFAFFNKKCSQVFVGAREDIVQHDNLIFKNQEYNGKIYYNKPCYETHLSMFDLFEKREDMWDEKN